MEEEKIKVVKTWLEPQSVRDIQVFLGFANFYRKFIKNFNRIVILLTSMLRTIDNEALSTQVTENEKNQDILNGIAEANSGGVDRNIKNLSIIVKSAKFKKPKLTKPKKSDLVKAQNFAKTNSSKIDFLTPKAKKAFIYL